MIWLKSSENPRDAFAKLITARVQSAPVWDERQEKFVGYLDLRDLVSCIVQQYDGHEKLGDAPPPAPKHVHPRAEYFGDGSATAEFVNRMIETKARVNGLPIEGVTLLFLTRRHGFRCVSETATLDDVARLLVYVGVHRVFVVDETGTQIVNVISQSTLIAYIDKHSDHLGALGAHTVGKAACGTAPVLSVKVRFVLLMLLLHAARARTTFVFPCERVQRRAGKQRTVDC